jgi:ubiquinone biosynthesis monooxygenase Coq7
MIKKLIDKKILQALPSPLTREQQVQTMLRVNQAGEHGAVRIYQGQLAALSESDCAATLEHMQEQEEAHRDYFNKAITKAKARPTLLSPIWDKLGYFLGLGCGYLGIKAAMACTIAIEEVIAEHYQEQLVKLETMPEYQDLGEKIAQFRAEELEHHDIGIEHDALNLEIYPILTQAIKKGSKLAIWLASRI